MSNLSEDMQRLADATREFTEALRVAAEGARERMARFTAAAFPKRDDA